GFLAESGDQDVADLPLGALSQRCVLRFGRDTLSSLFQKVLLDALETPAPPLVDALARAVGPGAHVTLLWRPVLEHALPRHHPGRTTAGVQPSAADGARRPRVVKRAAGATAWTREPALPKHFELDRDVVVLRLAGGYSAEVRPILTSPILTED